MNKILRNRDFLKNRKGKILIEGVTASSLAKKFGTPLYVYSESRIRANAQRIKNALEKFIPHSKLFYAIKANNNLSVLSILRQEALGADAAGPYEIELAKKAGFSKSKILYSGVFHSDEELKFGLKSGVAINVDSLSAAKRLLHFGKPPLFSMRVNPGIAGGKIKGLVFAGADAKFGESLANATKAFRLAKQRGIKKFGLHMMTGSCVLDDKYFGAATTKLLEFAGKIRKAVGIQFEFIDIGGGLGIPYRAKEKILDVAKAIRVTAKIFRDGVSKFQLGNPQLMLEPGRYIVGDAGVLLTRVGTVKQAQKIFIGVDAGMQTLLRPMLYDAWHEILVDGKLNSRASQKVSVVGPICENTDQLARDRLLPKITEKDLLAILDAGAYGFGMGSNYNTRARPAEVLAKGKSAELIRGREGISEIIGKQKIPQRLKK
ncbi:MAG: diaminopimelate decarboxylase [Candidatus Peribacteraceae bacterium]|nr:diaminopimelate decarboxylase [Candidatus Peribacteraceae bacterium]